MDADTLKRRMLARLEEAFGGLLDLRESEFDMEAAIYWYASDNYAGQGDALYGILSKSQFRPGPSHRSVKDEGEIATMMYRELKNSFGRKSVRSMKFRNPPSGAPNMVWGMYLLIALNRIYKIRLAPTKLSALPGWISIQTGTRLVIDALRQKFGPMDYHDPRVQTVIQMAKSMELVQKNPASVRKNIFVFNNSPSGPADETAAHELELYIDNDRNLYFQQFIPIVKNLMLKRRKGVYDRELAVKLFMYLMDAGAKKYVREFGTAGQKIDAMFNKNTRLLAARAFRDSFENEAELGNYDRLIGPVSNPRSVRKNIFLFNNGPRKLNAMEQAAAAVGLVIGTWAPGDGVTRYRFFLKSGKSSYGDYHQGDGVYTALGRKDAMAFIAAFGKGRSARTNPPSKSVRAYKVPSGHEERVARMLRDAFIWAQARDGEVLTLARPDILKRAVDYVRKHGYPMKNPLTRSEAGYLLRHARADVREAGSARRHGLVGEQKYHTGRARGIGFAVQETGPKAARRTWVAMHTTLDRVLRNPPVCANPIVRGDKLPYNLQREILNSFGYRWTKENEGRARSWYATGGVKPPRIPLISDAQWLREHAFHVTKDGRLSLRHHHAEPHYMADDWKKGDPLPNPLLQTVFAANPPISAQWDSMQPRVKAKTLMFAGVPEDLAHMQARRSWSTLPPSAKRALEGGWLDTSRRPSGGTTVRRLAPVGAVNPLTRREAGQVLRDARFDVRHGSTFQGGHTRSSRAGMAFGKAKVVRQYGPKVARRAADRISDKARKVARTTISNPGGLRLPAPGTKMTVAQAMALARRIGDRALIKECQAAAKLQTKANSHAKSVTWKHLPMGSKDKIDSVVALTHYGDSPEDMYRPPKGSKKGTHMYRHKWGDGSGRSRPVPVLASPSGKMIVKVMGPGQKVGDWMRG